MVCSVSSITKCYRSSERNCTLDNYNKFQTHHRRHNLLKITQASLIYVTGVVQLLVTSAVSLPNTALTHSNVAFISNDTRK